MGVLACGRTDCEEVMCDRIILEHSMYICNKCWDELEIYKESLREQKLTFGQLREKIVEFMCSKPGTYLPVEPVDFDKAFEELTRRHW